MKRTILLLLISVAALLLCSCGRGKTETPAPAETPAAAAPESAETEKQTPIYDGARCFTADGSVTAYALTALDGETLCALLEEKGYVWNEGERAFCHPDSGCKVLVIGPEQSRLDKDSPYEELRIADLDKGGRSTSLCYGVEYVSALSEDELLGLQEVAIVDTDSLYRQTDGSFKSRIAVIRSDDGACYLLDLFRSDDGRLRMSVVTEAACAANGRNKIVAYVLDEPKAVGGSSLDEIWSSLTGRSFR